MDSNKKNNSHNDSLNKANHNSLNRDDGKKSEYINDYEDNDFEKELYYDYADYDHDQAFYEDLLDSEDEEIKETTGRKKLIAGVVLVFFILTVFAGAFRALSTFPIEAYLESWKLSSDPKVTELREGVVSVVVQGGPETNPLSQRRTGTGFNIDPSGIILTNRHVVENSNSISVGFRRKGESKSYSVSEWYGSANPGVDLALLKIDGEDLPYVSIKESPSDGLERGDEVLIIGNPRGVGGIAVEGTVNNIHDLSTAPHVIMEIDAPIHPGHSGSPVFNESGEVVGIIYAAREVEGGKRVGIAISVENFIELKTDLDNDS